MRAEPRGGNTRDRRSLIAWKKSCKNSNSADSDSLAESARGVHGCAHDCQFDVRRYDFENAALQR